MHPRTNNVLEATNTSLKSPGPGTYTPKLNIDPKGNYFYSKYKSSKACVFNPSKTERFQPTSKDALKSPGPGTYYPKNEISSDGNYFNSRF